MSTAKEIGPFKPRQNPVRSGLYKRVSKKTGNTVYAYFNTDTNSWGLYASNKRRALERKNRRSKKDLPWFGLAKAPR